MARFNAKSAQINKTINRAGGEAFVQDPKLHFVSILLTSFVKDQFYRKSDETIKEVIGLIDQIPDKKFMAKAAIFARTKYGMRSISHVVAGEIAARVKGEQWTKNFFDKVVFRPDDMAEILSYYYNQGHTNEPKALRNGFSRAFSRFDEYQLAKYRMEGSQVSLVDIANLVHPKHSEAVAKLIKGTLPTPKTWESKLSETGKKAESEEHKEELKKEVWTELIRTRKIGYFALLRNLRNILEQAPEMIPEAAELLTDEKLISKSLVLPFRFTTAIKEIESAEGVETKKAREVLVALNKAIDISTKNVPRFDGDTLVVMDTSGSMEGQPLEIGSLFSAVLLKANNADFMVFADDAALATYNIMDSTLTIASQIRGCRGRVGGGTNFDVIFEKASKPYDRVIILSDMQGWASGRVPTIPFERYKQRLNTNPRVYSFDLQGYGTMQFPQENVFALAGFSEKIFDVMKLLESDRNALVREIEKVEL